MTLLDLLAAVIQDQVKIHPVEKSLVIEALIGQTWTKMNEDEPWILRTSGDIQEKTDDDTNAESKETGFGMLARIRNEIMNSRAMLDQWRTDISQVFHVDMNYDKPIHQARNNLRELDRILMELGPREQ